MSSTNSQSNTSTALSMKEDAHDRLSVADVKERSANLTARPLKFYPKSIHAPTSPAEFADYWLTDETRERYVQAFTNLHQIYQAEGKDFSIAMFIYHRMIYNDKQALEVKMKECEKKMEEFKQEENAREVLKAEKQKIEKKMKEV